MRFFMFAAAAALAVGLVACGDDEETDTAEEVVDTAVEEETE